MASYEESAKGFVDQLAQMNETLAVQRKQVWLCKQDIYNTKRENRELQREKEQLQLQIDMADSVLRKKERFWWNMYGELIRQIHQLQR